MRNRIPSPTGGGITVLCRGMEGDPMDNLLAWLSRLPRQYHLAIALCMTVGIGYVDYVTGYELRMELFYLLPISYITWFVGQRFGILFSVLSLITILYSDAMAGKQYSSFTVEFWNGAMYFVFYVIVTLLLKLRISLQQRENLLEELDKALRQNEELSGLLPVCPRCNAHRDDQEYRQQVDSYIGRHRTAVLNRGLCSACAAQLHPGPVRKGAKQDPLCSD